MTTETQPFDADHVVDARAEACPGPLVRTKRAVEAAEPGETVAVLSKDPGTAPDLERWCTKLGHEWLGAGLEDGVHQIGIRKAG
jgi:tRNA 2-thiouridine synthesizing protein A